ncbi:MAG: glycosyltransferase family 39 protein [Planctomycetota bacterium]
MPSTEKLCGRTAWAMLLGSLVLGAFTLADYGLTFDDPARARAGDDWLRFVASWDPSHLPRGFMANYGALFDMFAAALAGALRIWPGIEDDYLARHAAVFIAGWFGWLGTYRLAGRVAPQPVPLLALVLLMLTPRYYGACFNNPKDIPFAASAVWALYGLVRWLQEPGRRSAMRFGLLTALCVATRPFGVLFLPLGLGAWVLCRRPGASRVADPAWYLISSLLCSIALWPVLWVRPPWHLVQSVMAYGGRLAGSSHLYLGEVVGSTSPPAGYVAVWTAITLPLVTLLLFLFGAVVLFARGLSEGPCLGWRRALCLPCLLCLWILVPMVAPALHAVNLYSAVRHFLFLMPVIAVLAGVGLGRVLTLRARWLRALLLTLVVVGCADTVREQVRLHPYQTLYFSRLVGGIRGAEKEFDVAHFGETYEEAFRWLAEHHRSVGTEETPSVHTIGGHLTFDEPQHYARVHGMQLNGPSFEYYISEVRLGREDHFAGEVIHVIEREGVALAVVKRIEPTASPGLVQVNAPAPGEPGARWRSFEGRKGFFDTSALVEEGVGTGDLVMAVRIHWPRDQVVPLYWGYVGAGTLRTPARGPPPQETIIRLTRLMPPLQSALLRTDVALRAGVNELRVDLSGIDLSAGIYIHHPAP